MITILKSKLQKNKTAELILHETWYMGVFEVADHDSKNGGFKMASKFKKLLHLHET